jgi:hypothetical protein
MIGRAPCLADRTVLDAVLGKDRILSPVDIRSEPQPIFCCRQLAKSQNKPSIWGEIEQK